MPKGVYVRKPRDPWMRFFDKVKIGDGCWIWMAGKFDVGYGRFSLGGRGGIDTTASRVSWLLAGNTIPEGEHVLHKCDNRACVRPSHLFTGTDLDNKADMMAKGRQASGARNGMAKITAEIAVDIFQRCQRGESQKAIADRYNISQPAVSLIFSGINWSSATIHLR